MNLPPCMIYLVLQYLRGILQEFDFSAKKWQYQLYYLLFIICCCGCGEGVWRVQRHKCVGR